ncbi:MAG TPA: response regulator transcription factor [Vicinamibacterales bacterium]
MEVPETVRAPITILVAVGVRLYREGLVQTLSAQPHLRVAGTAATPLDVETAARTLRPDVVIVDVGFENASGLMRSLRVENPDLRILALAVREDINAILDCATAGADGFVTANGSMDELVQAIERTAAGELLCSPRIAAELLRRAAYQARHAAEPAGPALTLREQQVYALLRQGRSNKEIAAALMIAEATVKNHVHNVLGKLQVATRTQAAAAPGPMAKAELPPRVIVDRAG